MILKKSFVFFLAFNAMYSVVLAKAVDGLKVEVTTPVHYCAGRARDGDFLSIHYTGRFASNGKIFDSSRQKMRPYTFTLGRGEVIQGYEIGMQKMCLGEHRRFTVPPHLGKKILKVIRNLLPRFGSLSACCSCNICINICSVYFYRIVNT